MVLFLQFLLCECESLCVCACKYLSRIHTTIQNHWCLQSQFFTRQSMVWVWVAIELVNRLLESTQYSHLLWTHTHTHTMVYACIYIICIYIYSYFCFDLHCFPFLKWILLLLVVVPLLLLWGMVVVVVVPLSLAVCYAQQSKQLKTWKSGEKKVF